MKTAVQINCSSFKYLNNDEQVLKNFQFELNYGEITLLAGSSGSGKSTIVNLINGIIPRVTPGIFDGKIYINGEDICNKTMSEITAKTGSVLQNAEQQIIYQIIEDEIAFGCENLGMSPEYIKRQIEEKTKSFHLDPSWNTKTLSGGQKQRIITASILAMNHNILIFDEPLANLDKTGADILLSLLKKFANEGKAVFIIEHRLDVVLPYIDKVWVLKDKTLNRISDKNNFLKSQSKSICDINSYKIKTDEPVIQISSLSKSFGKREILKSINLTVFKNERLLLSGENGCGKTTLLNIIGRLQKADSGKIIQNINSSCSEKANKKWFNTCGFIYQNPNYQLFMSSVKDELLFNCKDRNYANLIAERLELNSLLERHPQSLSEGQKRRVTVAAILAQKPQLLLLDEPTVGQDYHNLKLLISLINEIHHQNENTMISITHDIRCEKALCDRKVLIEDGFIKQMSVC